MMPSDIFHHLTDTALGEFSLKEASDGSEAVEIVRAWRPDVIFMDRIMPVMDGLKATEVIRGTEGGKTIHIALVTGDSRAPAMWRAWGFDSFFWVPPFINHPDEIESLLSTLSRSGTAGADGVEPRRPDLRSRRAPD